MISITKDIKNGTTIVKYGEGLDLETTQVTVIKKKVKTAKGDFETIKVFSKSPLTTFDGPLKLLKVLEVVG